MQAKEFRGEIIVPLPIEPAHRANMVAAVSHAWSLLMSELEGIVDKERQRIENATRMAHARKGKARRGRPPKRSNGEHAPEEVENAGVAG